GVVSPAAHRAAHALVRIGTEERATSQAVLESEAERRPVVLEAPAPGPARLADRPVLAGPPVGLEVRPPRDAVPVLVEDGQVGRERVRWRGGAAHGGFVVAVAVGGLVRT